VGKYWKEYYQVYFNSVTTGELEHGLNRVFSVVTTELSTGTKGNDICVNEDFFSDDGEEPGWVSGDITLIGQSGDKHAVELTGV